MQKQEKIPKGYKKTEIGVIPEDWEVKRLGEVFEVSAGGDVDKSKFSNIKSLIYKYPIYSNALENDGLYGYSSEFRFEENSITVTARGTLGVATPRYEKFVAIIRLLVLHPKMDVDIKFISEYINGKIEFSIESTGVPQLTSPQISNYKIPLPPFPEQRAIAKILSDFDKLIESFDSLIEKKKLIRKGAMQQLLTGKKRLPGFKGKWARRKLGEITIIKKGDLITEKGAKQGNIPVIGGGIGPTYYHNKANRKANTITISASGANAGHVSFHEYPIFASDCSTIEESENYDVRFLYFFLKSIQNIITKLQTGGAQPHVYPEQLKQLEIYYPLDIKEQRAIAKILSDMDVEIKALEKKKQKYEMMKKGAMELLLTGKVRVESENLYRKDEL